MIRGSVFEDCEPITTLQCKGARYEWTYKCNIAFIKINRLLTNAFILWVPDMEKSVTICMDASKWGLGATLTQKRGVIAYVSRKLKKYEELYATHNLELASVILSLKPSRCYLIQRSFDIRTYHKSLEHVPLRGILMLDKGEGVNS